MSSWFENAHPVWQALVAGCFTWGVTAAGAALVFFTQSINRRLLDAMLGFAAGVMTAASFWSLLAPSIAIAEARPEPAWLPALVGFLAGGAALWIIDRTLPHLHPDMPLEEAEGPKTGWERSVLLVSAITIHNVPEGLAVGVAFGGVVSGLPSASVGAAVALAVGIGLQNFPEGIAVAMPLRGDGMSRGKSFFYGQLSAVVEPLAAVIGAAAVVYAAPILPYALSFAAGAMIYVVVEELIPESQRAGRVDWSTLWFMVGFSVMMVLDVALG
ncbi:MAG: ZIP family metal transporter [Planctomycetota bacterium]|nr:MAG: ZIP family metal transporter [Planctomycetota bacterium]REJ87841.1 MAG: ZIP family metal transporter [Planctomycetota bacterium]REK27899.1 MAG: ZIP family metal transporter [Planctomycetota bacterium]REK40297.1 MAG: ZIP family metal transporter [Planctomycetota bacterium]